jgi:phosphotriesterase-related protein
LDVNDAIAELQNYKVYGGNSLVEVSLPGMARDPVSLRKISMATGLNIVCGTGWYVESSHPAYVRVKSVDELAAIMIGELTTGIGNTGVKAGVMGEIGCSYPLTDDERKVLKAVARAQQKTGAGFTIHPGGIYEQEVVGKNEAGRAIKRPVRTINECLDLFQKEGADLSKMYVSHMDLWCSDLEYSKLLADRYGVTLSYDSFGQEYYSEWIGFPGCGSPHDRERVNALMSLLDAGLEKQLVVSHDVCEKILLVKYGGWGYAHILKNIIPWLVNEGATDKQIRAMTVENPKRLLSY